MFEKLRSAVATLESVTMVALATEPPDGWIDSDQPQDWESDPDPP